MLAPRYQGLLHGLFSSDGTTGNCPVYGIWSQGTPATCPTAPKGHLAQLGLSIYHRHVLALDNFKHQNEVGRQTGARKARLDHQLHAAHIAVVGIQEARIPNHVPNLDTTAVNTSIYSHPVFKALGPCV